MTTNTQVWDLPTRIFHWTLAASFAGAYVLSESERLRSIHVALGYTVLGLLAFRLVWGFVGPRYARFRSFIHSPVAALRYLRDELRGCAPRYLGHNPAGSWAVYGLLILGLATGVTGYLNLNELGGESMEDLHEAFANAWLVLVGLHILGVVLSSVMQRENLARSMITGLKRGVAADAEPRTARGLGLAMAAAILGFWGWTATSGSLAPGASQGHERGEQSELATDRETDDD
jgi:cytochrome b